MSFEAGLGWLKLIRACSGWFRLVEACFRLVQAGSGKARLEEGQAGCSLCRLMCAISLHSGSISLHGTIGRR